MLNNTRGGWNSGGRSPTPFLAVAALAVANEISEAEGLRGQIMGMAVEAFVRKGWTDGFYRMIGSRQVVRRIVDSAILFPRPVARDWSDTRLKKRNEAGGDYSFEQARNAFLSGVDGLNLSGGLVGTMDSYLGNPMYHGNDDRAPYDWGNPTKGTNERFPLFMAELARDIGDYDVLKQKKTGETEIYYRNTRLNPNSYDPGTDTYPVFFVLTQPQQKHWCPGYSCVVP